MWLLVGDSKKLKREGDCDDRSWRRLKSMMVCRNGEASTLVMVATQVDTTGEAVTADPQVKNTMYRDTNRSEHH